MFQKTWIKMFIGLVVFSISAGGCVKAGPTVSSPEMTVQSENEFDPARGLDPISPSFWLDYQNIYAPRS